MPLTPRRTGLTRRALLCRALCGSIALPFMSTLAPATEPAGGDESPKRTIPKRLVVVYLPHGMYLPDIKPTTTGFNFAVPASLAPLEPLKGRFSVIGNLSMDRTAGIMHRAGEMFLTNERVPENNGGFRLNGLSMDRLVIDLHAGQTLVPSLELSLSPVASAGLRNTVSFDGHGTPYLGEHDPRKVFDLLFGSGSPEERRAALREQRSILDSATPDAKRLAGSLGGADRRVLDEYLESIRATEGYLERLEKRVDQPVKPEDEGLDFDPHATIAQRMRTMFDLMYLALHADLTRVITFTVFRERADAQMSYPDLGLVGEHHSWSHGIFDGGDSTIKSVRCLKAADHYHCEQLAHFLQRLHDTPEGSGTMLDNTVVLYGCGLTLFEGGVGHDPSDLPLVLAGGEAMGFRQGQHVRYKQPTNLANLHLTLLNQLGVPRTQWKDSTGTLSELVA